MLGFLESNSICHWESVYSVGNFDLETARLDSKQVLKVEEYVVAYFENRLGNKCISIRQCN